MRNKLIVCLVTVTLLLTACTNSEGNKNSNLEEVQLPQQTEVVEEVKEEMEPEQEKNEPEQKAVHDEKWVSLPEYETIMENIDSDIYSFEMVTDNVGKRILLLTNEAGEAKYKSIFIKSNNQLKIINVDGEGQVFYGSLTSE